MNLTLTSHSDMVLTKISDPASNYNGKTVGDLSVTELVLEIERLGMSPDFKKSDFSDLGLTADKSMKKCIQYQLAEFMLKKAMEKEKEDLIKAVPLPALLWTIQVNNNPNLYRSL